MDKPIKILFLAANPRDSTQLRLDEEIRGIKQSLYHAKFRDNFDIEQEWAVGVSELQGHLLRHQPDIVHFSGHGSTASEIILEDNVGNSQTVSIRALSDLFFLLKDNIRCVVLNACYSEPQAQAIAKSINCVIGMSKAIGDKAAISFAVAFYQALGFGRNVKTAFDLGCLQIDLEGLDEQKTPKLLAISNNPQELVFVHDQSVPDKHSVTKVDITESIDVNHGVLIIKEKAIKKALPNIVQQSATKDITDYIKVVVRSNRFGTKLLYQVPHDITVNAFTHLVIDMLGLPQYKRIEELKISFDFSYSVFFDGKKLPLNSTLRDAGVSNESEVMLSINYLWKDEIKEESQILGPMTRYYKLHDEVFQFPEWFSERNAIEHVAYNCFSFVDQIGSLVDERKKIIDMNKNLETILEIFRGNDAVAKQQFIAQLPGTNEEAMMMAGIEEPEYGMIALETLASSYYASFYKEGGGNVEYGAWLGKICYQLALEFYQKYGRGKMNLNVRRVGGSARTCVSSLKVLGRNDELIHFANEAIPMLEEMGDSQSVFLIHLDLIEAHLNLGNYEIARTLLESIENKNFSESDRFLLSRVLEKFGKIFKVGAQLPDNTSGEEEVRARYERTLVEGAGVFRSVDPKIADVFDKLLPLLVAKSARENLIENPPVEIALPVDWPTDLLTNGNEGARRNEMNELEIMLQIRQATNIFLDPVLGNDPQAIARSLVVFNEVLPVVKNKFLHHENDALWGLYLCHSRLKQNEKAVEVLQMLRANIEKSRARITNPLERAGMMTHYPNLFRALCQQLCRLNRSAELLDAMEGAKGRALADILSEREGQPVSDQIFSEPARQLPELMKRLNAHYLSYFVDDEEIYAVLVAKDGSVHSHAIPLSKEKMNVWMKEIDPKKWGKPSHENPLVKTLGDLPEKLSPLVEWLEPFFDSGKLEKNDHICYCPDDALHLLPLHYVLFKAEPLAQFFSLSRIHGALALLRIMQEEEKRPAQFIAVQVSAQQDQNNEEKLATFAIVSDWLGEKMAGEILKDQAAQLDALRKLPFDKRLVHFATHGTFDKNGNPYLSSGLLLAKNDKLPNLSSIIHDGAIDFLLSPQKLLDLGRDFSDSHVTLQACVSGLSKEGIGKDALGLEWAFLQTGATSLLSSHWNVEAESAAAFSISFYKRWLAEGKSRAEAWRETILEIIDSKTPVQHAKPYYWAAFSLSGDWR